MYTFTEEELDLVIHKVMKDYKPFIEYLGGGRYMINAGRWSCLTNRAGAIEFDKALKEKTDEYIVNAGLNST